METRRTLQETLRQLGERGDIIKRIHRALDGRSGPFQVFEPRDGVRIEGVVRRKGLHDEQSGEPYVVIQTPRDEALYVRLDQATAAELKEGAAVRLSCARQPWLKATDEILQRDAHANFGIYSPTAHLRKLGERPLVIGGQPVKPEDVIAVNLRRLERLARYKLVTKRPDGTWFIPPNLISRLRDREQTHPRFRLIAAPLRPEPTRPTAEPPQPKRSPDAERQRRARRRDPG